VIPFLRKSSAAPPPDDATPARDPFLAVPEVAPRVEGRVNAENCIHLRRRIPPKGRIAGFLARTLGWNRDVLVNLDPRGSAFWRLVDGQRNLESIQSEIRKQWNLKDEESRRAVLLFTRDLMTRGLLRLRYPIPPDGDDPS
jgi:hypothetical protein